MLPFILFPFRKIVRTCLFLVTLILLLPAQAEENETDVLIPAQKSEMAQVQAKITELEAVAELDQNSKAALDFFRLALNRLNTAKENRDAAAGYRKFIDTAAEQKKVLAESLQQAKIKSKKTSVLPLDLSLGDLSQRFDLAEADRKLEQAKLAELTAVLASERTRPDQTATELVEARVQLSELKNKLAIPDNAGDVVLIAEARQTSQLASQELLVSRINRLDLERLSYGTRVEQLNTRIEIAQEVLKRAENQVQSLQELINKRRNDEAFRALQDAALAKLEASGKHMLIQTSVAENAKLSEKLSALTDEIEQVVQTRKRLGDQITLIEHNLARVKQQLDITGLDELVGQLLRSQRNELPNTFKLQRKMAREQRRLAELRLEQFRIEEQRRHLSTDDQINLILEQNKPADIQEKQWKILQREQKVIYQDRFQLLGQLRAVYIRYEALLSDLILEEQSLGDKASEYADLLDRNLIWIPSTQRWDFDAVKSTVGAIAWVFSSDNWAQVAQGIMIGLSDRPFKGLLALMVFSLLLGARARIRRDLENIATKVGNVSQDQFQLTLRALAHTLLLSLPWVVLLSTLGWMLIKSDVLPFSDAVNEGFKRSLSLFFVFQVIRYLFIPNGLAEVHFRWPGNVTALFRRHLHWLIPLLVSAVFIIGVTEWQNDEVYKNSLGRSVFIIGMLAYAIFAHLTLNPWTGVPRYLQKGDANWWSRGMIWYPLSMVAVFLLILLSFEGYHYTAITLERLLLLSTEAGLLVFILHNLAVRWLLVAERRLALARARTKRQMALEARVAKEVAEAAGEGLPDTLDMEEINLATINEQTRRLLSVVIMLVMAVLLALIWSKLTPALGFLDEIVLWQHVSQGAEGELITSISIVDGALACLVLVLMVVAGRNLPGLLEIALLEPLSVEPGTRYAVANIGRYLIYSIGTITVFAMLGLVWNDVQWLVAAMGVGLGFGLKEIFANLISGIMILFERPIRIGDTVTVGDISGTVGRIRIRATTITDWDNKELVVPNKTFIIDPLINWTLSDPITRLVINVGIAYASDTEKAHQIMMDVICAHPDVLKEPKPTVFFIGFGESALDFEIRVFVQERLMRMPLSHDLHMALDAALRKAGIELPFPQRDLHLRSVDPAIDLSKGRPPQKDK